MNLPCDIVQDLLPLYEDGLCSEISRDAVRAHLLSCPVCRTQAEGVRNLPPESFDAPSDTDRVTCRSFRKLRRRWAVSLIAAVLAVPLVLMSVGQYLGRGICFTNLDDTFAAWRYIRAVETADFDAAASCVNFREIYHDIHDYLDSGVTDSFTAVTVGDSAYAVRDDLVEAVPTEGSELEIWTWLIRNWSSITMTPIEIWDAVMALEPELYTQLEDGAVLYDGWLYTQLQTEWGIFMVDGQNIPEITGPEDYVYYYALIPHAIYDAARPTVQENAEQAYHEFAVYNSDVAAMTEEEFVDYMHLKYVAQLEAWSEAGSSLSGRGWRDAYYTNENGGWTVYWAIHVESGQGSGIVELGMIIRDGKVSIVTMRHDSDRDWCNGCFEALLPHIK